MSTTTTKSRGNRGSSNKREDVYTRITNQVIAQLEQGVRPWMKPWNAEHAAGRITRPLRCNGEAYNGINILMLWESAEEQGFACPLWLTFKQAKELGGHVRKGEHGSSVVYASTFSKTEETDAGETIDKDIPFLKQYTVFNAEQCEGLPDRFYALKQAPISDIERIAEADSFFRGTGAEIVEGGNRACYVQSQDVIRMPKLETFVDAESHAATLAHELTHWTKHVSRLDRDLGRKKWGDEGYAMEELVAEMGAAFLCADLGITPELRDDHASYLDYWLTVLKQDKRAIFQAASLASKAVAFLHDLQPATQTEQA
ncbi:ArdC family protein [Roseiconus lacunae]|uniref:ArdC family protein n=1 Tax=Roseiconus lacunae TaxID=2605694 RepID=UPI001E448092|nr:zincin-like metallopeptidase domain-containing protein [Roseiconus lacunae]MCD0462085.1 ssDNA-binding domain-containing protein [Roseiconus lacunae]